MPQHTSCNDICDYGATGRSCSWYLIKVQAYIYTLSLEAWPLNLSLNIYFTGDEIAGDTIELISVSVNVLMINKKPVEDTPKLV